MLPRKWNWLLVTLFPEQKLQKSLKVVDLKVRMVLIMSIWIWPIWGQKKSTNDCPLFAKWQWNSWDLIPLRLLFLFELFLITQWVVLKPISTERHASIMSGLLVKLPVFLYMEQTDLERTPLRSALFSVVLPVKKCWNISRKRRKLLRFQLIESSQSRKNYSKIFSSVTGVRIRIQSGKSSAS